MLAFIQWLYFTYSERVAEFNLKKLLYGREGRGNKRDTLNTRLQICIVSKYQLQVRHRIVTSRQ